MFSNIQLFRIQAINPAFQDLGTAENTISAYRFIPCGASQEKSAGWVEPRNEKHGALIESVAGQWILKFQRESKILPASVVRQECENQILSIEQSTGRKPGRKEKREIKEDVRSNLLLKAFTKQSSTFVWIDFQSKLLVIDAASKTGTDEILTLLIKCMDGLVLQAINTQTSPSSAMAMWLKDSESPQGFTLDRDCTLSACDESKATVRYARHSLDTEEVQSHIKAGKLPKQLALTWRDRVSFSLTDAWTLKKINLLDVAFESSQGEGKDDVFDADVTMITSELSQLLVDLIESLGGEVN